MSGIVAWHTISNLNYILAIVLGPEAGTELRLAISLQSSKWRPPIRTLDIALSLDMRDFEEPTQVSAAIAAGAE